MYVFRINVEHRASGVGSDGWEKCEVDLCIVKIGESDALFILRLLLLFQKSLSSLHERAHKSERQRSFSI